MGKIQEKWRDSLINLDDIKFKNIKIEKIISYPPAGNDVFECIGKYKNKNLDFIIKSERGNFANFKNEIAALERLQTIALVPKVLEHGTINNHTYIVLSKIDGDKLSDIFREDKTANKNKYLYNYGKELAKIHNFNIKWENAKIRDINNAPCKEKYKDLNKWEKEIIDYLNKNEPNIDNSTFIHGDFHYGNILWNNYSVTGILDWEYAGNGFKEQDIAWALILRPGQEFMDNKNDWDQFLNGYKSLNTYDEKKLKWCLINGMMHFYLMNRDKEDYKQKLANNIKLLKN